MNIAELEVVLSADVTDVDKAIQGAVANAKRQARDLGREVGRSLSEAGAGLMRFGTGVTAAISLPLAAAAKKAFDAAVTIDTLERSMSALMGSSEEARKELERLREVAKLPGIGFEAAALGSQRLQAVGLEAGKARDLLIELSNANALAGGSMDNLQGALIQLSQTLSSGFLQGDELRIIAERIPLFRRALVEAFGTANSEIIGKAMKEGELTMEAFVDGMIRGLSTMPRAQESVQTQLDNLKDQIFQSFAEIGRDLLPIVEDAMKRASEFVKRLVEAWRELSEEQKKVIFQMTALAAAIGPIILALGSLMSSLGSIIQLTSTLSAAWTTAGGALGIARVGMLALTGPIGLVTAAITALGVAWATNAGDIRTETAEMVQELKESFADIREDLEELGVTAENIGIAIAYVRSNFHMAMTVFVQAVRNIVASVTFIVQSVLDSIKTQWRLFHIFFTGDINDLRREVVGYFQRMWDRVVALFARAAESLLKIVRGIMDGWNMINEAVGIPTISTAGIDIMIQSAQIAQRTFKGLAGDIKKTTEAASGGAAGATGWLIRLATMPTKPSAPETYSPPQFNLGGSDDLGSMSSAMSEAQKQAQDLRQQIADLTKQVALHGNTLQSMAMKYDLANGVIDQQNIHLALNALTLQEQIERLDAAAKARDEATRAEERYASIIQSLQRELAGIGVSSREYQAILDTTIGDLKDLSDAQKREVINVAGLIDKKHQEIEAREALTDAIRSEQNAVRNIMAGLTEELAMRGKETRVERLKVELEQFGHVADWVKNIVLHLAQQLDAMDRRDAYIAWWKRVRDAVADAVKEMRDAADERFGDSMRDLNVRAIEAAGGLKLANHELQELAESFGGGFLGLLRAEQYMARLLDVQRLEEWRSSLERTRDVILDSFERMFDDLFENGFNNFFDNVINGFRNMLVQMASEYLQSQIRGFLMRQLGGVISGALGGGGGGGGSIAGALGMLGMHAGRSVGGPVTAGQAYLVGEHGPEMFVPSSNGRIRNDSQMGGGQIVINMTVHAKDADSFRRSRDQIVGELGRAIGRHRLRTG